MQELEETITALKSQVVSLQQRVTVHQEESALLRRQQFSQSTTLSQLAGTRASRTLQLYAVLPFEIPPAILVYSVCVCECECESTLVRIHSYEYITYSTLFTVVKGQSFLKLAASSSPALARVPRSEFRRR